MISFIIPSYNSEYTIGRTLGPILQSRIKGSEIIIIDDHSTDSTIRAIQDISRKYKDKKIRLIRNKKNMGAAYSRNMGIKSAKGDILFFIDSDVIIEKASIKRIVESLEKGDADTVYPLIRYENGKMMHPVTEEEKRYPAISACFAARKESFDSSALFFDEYYHIYLEDADLFIRCRLSGLRSIYCSDAIATHLDRPRKDQKERYFLELRNMIYGNMKTGGVPPFTFFNTCKIICYGILNFAWFDWSYGRDSSFFRKLMLIISGKHRISKDWLGIQSATIRALKAVNKDRKIIKLNKRSFTQWKNNLPR